MKTIVPLLPVALLLFSSCAGPAARHDARVDRRYDRRDRLEYRADSADDRMTTRQNARYDRRADRQDRIDSRYDYQ